MKHRQPLSFTAGFLQDSRHFLYTAQTLKAMLGGLEPLPAGPVLDIGSGSGYLLGYLTSGLSGPSRPGLAIDIDPTVLDGAINRLMAAAVCADGAMLPVRSGSVAIAAIHFVLSRVPRATAHAIFSEAVRILKPGGRVLAVEPCLGMSTYHSDRDENLGVLVGLARRLKAQRQSVAHDIDENFGLRLPGVIPPTLRTEVVDLHVARWYTPFPQRLDQAGRDILERRLADLRRAPGGAAFLKSHGSRIDASLPGGANGATVTQDGRLTLTEEGFRCVSDGRAADLEAALAGKGEAHEFIPVVRVVASKEP